MHDIGSITTARTTPPSESGMAILQKTDDATSILERVLPVDHAIVPVSVTLKSCFVAFTPNFTVTFILQWLGLRPMHVLYPLFLRSFIVITL
jgi:hypothetical protein